MSKHDKFILSPMINILEDALTACSPCGSGMETFPLCEYVMQSVFLKMTGFNEQKLKCILWELATDDYEFRYTFLKDRDYGECSLYKDKNNVFKMLISFVTDKKECEIVTDTAKSDLLQEIKNQCSTLFNISIMKIWLPKEYENYKKFINCDLVGQLLIKNENKKDKDVITTYNLFQDKASLKDKKNNIKDAFEKLYHQRNRYAHNSLSYQNNLPTLDTLIEDDYNYENWFIRFFILILIDTIFIRLYKEYITLAV